MHVRAHDAQSINIISLCQSGENLNFGILQSHIMHYILFH